MAPPQVIGNENPSLESQCLAFIQTLINQQIGFNFHLTSGSFSCSFDNNGKRKITPARTPSQVKHKTPSTRKRDARRRQQFLENKKFRASSVEQPDQVEPTQSHSESICALGATAVFESPQHSAHKEPTQPFSESLCFPSASESAHLDPNNHDGGQITKKMRMEKVPPLKVLVDAKSSPKYRIQQTDGNSSLSDISLCDQRSEHDDDPKMGQSTFCPNCDQPLLSISHQCHYPDQQTNIDNHPKNGHSEETGKDRIFDFEREYLATHPDLPVDYKKIKEKYFSPWSSSWSTFHLGVLKLFLEEHG